MEDVRMSIVRVSEATISDGKGGETVVRPGDQVWLSPEADTKFMHEYCAGEEPYTISWIGRWPCGGVNIYLVDGIGIRKSIFQSSPRG